MGHKDTNIFTYNIIQRFFYPKNTYAIFRTIFPTTRNQIMITGETKAGIMRKLVHFTDSKETEGQWIIM